MPGGVSAEGRVLCEGLRVQQRQWQTAAFGGTLRPWANMNREF